MLSVVRTEIWKETPPTAGEAQKEWESTTGRDGL